MFTTPDEHDAEALRLIEDATRPQLVFLLGSVACERLMIEAYEHIATADEMRRARV